MSVAFHKLLENNFDAPNPGDIESFGVVSVIFTDHSSHNSVLQEVIQKLAHAGFAPEKEIKEEWLTLLKSELEK